MNHADSNQLDPAIVSRIGECKLIPVLRMTSEATCTELALELLNDNYPVVEIATTSPEWDITLREALSARTGTFVGVGTIRSQADAARALDLGASFWSHPH